jgi:hypothetical protein
MGVQCLKDSLAVPAVPAAPAAFPSAAHFSPPPLTLSPVQCFNVSRVVNGGQTHWGRSPVGSHGSKGSHTQCTTHHRPNPGPFQKSRTAGSRIREASANRRPQFPRGRSGKPGLGRVFDACRFWPDAWVCLVGCQGRENPCRCRFL